MLVLLLLCAATALATDSATGSTGRSSSSSGASSASMALDGPTIKAEKAQYLSIATVDSLTTDVDGQENLINEALSEARSEESKSNTTGADEGFNQLENALADDFTGGATGSATGGDATGGDATGTDRSSKGPVLTGHNTGTGSATGGSTGSATGSAASGTTGGASTGPYQDTDTVVPQPVVEQPHFPDALPSLTIEDQEGTTKAITFTLILEGIKRLKASSITKFTESLSAYIGTEADISIESIHPVVNAVPKHPSTHLRRRLLAFLRRTTATIQHHHPALLIKIKITTTRGSEVQSAIDNLGAAASKADAVASLVELMHANGLDGVENIFVNASPVAVVVAVEKPKAPLPVPALADPAAAAAPVVKTVDEASVLAGLPAPSVPVAAAATGGGGGATGAEHRGVPVAKKRSTYMEGSAIVNKVLKSGNAGHWNYIIRSHGGEERGAHKDPAALAMFGLHAPAVKKSGGKSEGKD